MRPGRTHFQHDRHYRRRADTKEGWQGPDKDDTGIAGQGGREQRAARLAGSCASLLCAFDDVCGILSLKRMPMDDSFLLNDKKAK